MTMQTMPALTEPARLQYLLTVGLLLAALLQSALPTTGVVERIVDGDTLVLAGIGAVRLIGIDAPESKHPRRPVEAFARESAAFLRTIADGQTVRLEYDQTTRDRYGRLLAYLHLSDGQSVNEQMVRQGYAFAYTRYPFKYLERYRTLEREARDAGRGLWASEKEED